MKEKKTMQEMNEQYKDKPFTESVYEINGKLFAVTSHFIGEKDIDKVLFNLAYKKALQESENG